MGSVEGFREGARLTQEEPLVRSRGKSGQDSHRKGCGERQEGELERMDRKGNSSGARQLQWATLRMWACPQVLGGPSSPPEVLHSHAHTLKLTRGTVDNDVSEHGRLLGV